MKLALGNIDTSYEAVKGSGKDEDVVNLFMEK